MSDFEQKVLDQLKTLAEGQSQLRDDVKGLQEGQSQLRDDVKGLQEGQSQLRDDVKGLQEGQSQLQKDVRRLEVLHEETSEKIDQIIEAVSPEMQTNNEQNARIDDHEERIQKLELSTR